MLFALFVIQHQSFPCYPESKCNRTMQRRALMQMLCFESDADAQKMLENFNIIDHPISFSNECHWRGVSCVLDHVTTISWHAGVSIDKVDVNWMPALLFEAHIKGHSVDRLDTRQLPCLNLYILEIRNCNMQSTIDFGSLPPRLQFLDLSNNRLEGGVSLFSLPPEIESIDLRGNNFDCVLVCNESLPETLKWVKLRQWMPKRRVMCLDGKKVDGRVYVEKMK